MRSNFYHKVGLAMLATALTTCQSTERATFFVPYPLGPNETLMRSRDCLRQVEDPLRQTARVTVRESGYELTARTRQKGDRLEIDIETYPPFTTRLAAVRAVDLCIEALDRK